MIFSSLADAVLLLHLLFVWFVVLGGVAAFRWPRLIWLHLPCFVWGVVVELTGWICPLTPLENHLRRKGGGEGYGGSFIEQYLLPLLYPDGLTRTGQVILALLALGINVAIYGILLSQRQSLGKLTQNNGNRTRKER